MQGCDNGTSGRSADPTSVVVETGIYREVDLTYWDDEICGSYREGTPVTVTVFRTGARISDTVPIGTRTAANLRASIDGRDILVAAVHVHEQDDRTADAIP